MVVGVVQLPGGLGNKWAKGFLCLWKLSWGLKVDSLVLAFEVLSWAMRGFEWSLNTPLVFLILLFNVSLGPVPLSCLSLLLVLASHSSS